MYFPYTDATLGLSLFLMHDNTFLHMLDVPQVRILLHDIPAIKDPVYNKKNLYP